MNPPEFADSDQAAQTARWVCDCVRCTQTLGIRHAHGLHECAVHAAEIICAALSGHAGIYAYKRMPLDYVQSERGIHRLSAG